MTNTNVAANTAATTPAAEPAAVLTKMDHARKLFAEVYSQGYKFKVEGSKSQRNEFVKRAIAEFGMTKNGAATYFQNLSNEAKGEKLYKYTSKKKADVPGAEGQLTETTNAANTAADNNKSAAEGAIGEFRWTCNNEAGEEVASFPVRKTADEYSKANGLVRGDRNIAPKAE